MRRPSAAAAKKVAETFPGEAAIAGGCGCGSPNGQCACTPPVFPPGSSRAAAMCVPYVGENGNGYFGMKTPISENNNNNKSAYVPPAVPYADQQADARNMTLVVGEATIAAGATTDVNVQPTMGRFSMYYVEIYAVDAANPQSRQRVTVGRFSVGDCPGDCRTIPVFSDVFEADHACCNGRPLRADFGRTNDGTQLTVGITNPNASGSITVQVIARGYCHRGTCAC